MLKGVRTLITLFSLALLLLASCQGKPSSPTILPPEDGRTGSITLTARGLAFDRSSITVPAGTGVNVVFVNSEGLIAHNFAVYESPAAAKVLFRGDYISGGKTITYQFTPPSDAGAYFFRCDAHPTLMKGEFIVTAPQDSK